MGVTIWVSRWGVRVYLFAQGRVCQGVHPYPYPKAVGRRPVPPPSSNPGCLRRVGELEHWARSQRLPMLGSSCLLASVSSSLTWGSGLTVSVLDWPGIRGQVHCPARPRCPPLIQPTPNASPHTAMVELDGDDVRISSRGKLAERDIVQVKPKSCLPQGKCQSPSSQADLIPAFRDFSGKGPWREPQSGLATKEGNGNQSLGNTSPPG